MLKPPSDPLSTSSPVIRLTVVAISANDIDQYPDDDIAGLTDQHDRAGWHFPTLSTPTSQQRAHSMLPARLTSSSTTAKDSSRIAEHLTPQHRRTANRSRAIYSDRQLRPYSLGIRCPSHTDQRWDAELSGNRATRPLSPFPDRTLACPARHPVASAGSRAEFGITWRRVIPRMRHAHHRCGSNGTLRGVLRGFPRIQRCGRRCVAGARRPDHGDVPGKDIFDVAGFPQVKGARWLMGSSNRPIRSSRRTSSASKPLT